jgi:hypothetical protein
MYIYFISIINIQYTYIRHGRHAKAAMAASDSEALRGWWWKHGEFHGS